MAAGTVTYRYPGTQAPSAGHNKSLVVADVAMGAGANDDDTAVTHNLDLDPADGTEGAPVVSVTLTARGSAAVIPHVAFTNKDTLTVKAGAKGANCDFTARVAIMRPHSLIG